MSTNHPEVFEIIAERKLMARERASGKEKTVHIAVGKPMWAIQGEEACCRVLVKGLYYEKPQDICSIDPLSALQLTVEYIDKLMTGAADKFDFFWPDGEPFELR